MRPTHIGRLLLGGIALALGTQHPIIAIVLLAALVGYACCAVSGDYEQHINERDSDV